MYAIELRTRQDDFVWADGDYLGFVESIEAHLSGAPLEGPNDELLRSGWEIKTGFTRLRLGGVSLTDFIEIIGEVDPLQGPGRTSAERMHRLEQLTVALRSERLPLIDIHLPPWVALTSQVLGVARLGGWFLFSVQKQLEGRMAPVFFGEPETGAIDRRFLTEFAEAPGPLAERLRDIFSLAHVGDWGSDGDEGGTPVIPPQPPFDGDDIRILRVSWNAKDSFEEADSLEETLAEGWDEDRPQAEGIRLEW